MATIKEFSGKLNKLAQYFDDQKNQIEVAALSVAESLFEKRIFTHGIDANGQQIGAYADGSYKNLRARLGKRTSFKDLYFDGDLFRSISVGRAGHKNALGFTDPDEAQIADYQEEQTGKTVFTLSEEEKSIMQDVLKEEVNRIIKECFQT